MSLVSETIESGETIAWSILWRGRDIGELTAVDCNWKMARGFQTSKLYQVPPPFVLQTPFTLRAAGTPPLKAFLFWFKVGNVLWGVVLRRSMECHKGVIVDMRTLRPYDHIVGSLARRSVLDLHDACKKRWFKKSIRETCFFSIY